ncbi:MAG TPA: DUF6266 family protein [Chitinophagaceae bacterium]|jgi:hypothetical protein
MGRLTIGINGPVQGRIGTVIGSSWKGVPYVKGPYKKQTGKAPEGEARNQSKFAMAHYWLKPLKAFLREGFKGYAKLVEGFNAAKSYLLLHAFEGVAPSIAINPALVKVSSGVLPLPGNIVVSKTAAGQLSFTWDTVAGQVQNSKDQVMMLAYDVEHGKAYYNTLGEMRRAGADTLHTDPTSGKTYHVYCAFVAADRSGQSDSVYLGTIVM